MKTIKEKDLIPGEIYYDQSDKTGIPLEFVKFEINEKGKKDVTLFKPVGENNKYYPREEDGLLDFTYRKKEPWYQPE